MIPQIAVVVWFKSSIERLMAWGVVLYALRQKQDVAAKYGNGMFEIVATGNNSRNRLKSQSPKNLL
jgi:hypothetical protein